MVSHRAISFARLATPVVAIAIGFASTALLIKSDPVPQRDFAAESRARRPFVIEPAGQMTASSTAAVSLSRDSATPVAMAAALPDQDLPSALPSKRSHALKPDAVKRLSSPVDIIRPEPTTRRKAAHFTTVKVNGKPHLVERWVEHNARPGPIDRGW